LERNNSLLTGRKPPAEPDSGRAAICRDQLGVERTAKTKEASREGERKFLRSTRKKLKKRIRERKEGH